MEIPFHRPYTDGAEIAGVAESIRNGWLTHGPKTVEFEKRFGEYIGCTHALSFNSCTAALHLALACIDLKAGDEVIVPAMTFVATAEVVRYFGAMPVLVDAERDTHLIDADKIEEKISPRTKAIIPVHLTGQPADMDAISAIAEKNNLHVIDDAAHAFPSKYKGRYVGTLSDITCFSFYATKTLTAGEGGMAATENDEWAKRMKVLRLHGISRDAWNRFTKEGSWEYDVIDAGYKYNTTDINSAIALAQLDKTDFMQNRREYIAQRYDAAFAQNEKLIAYTIKEGRETSYHLYPLKLKLEALSIDRNAFIEKMKSRGVGCSVHYIPLYRFSYYKDLGFSQNDFPASEWIYERCFSLPIYPGMTDEEIDYVIEQVTDVIQANTR